MPGVDTIGVPVFSAIRGNEMFVPEMDGDFRISEFTEFFNEHGFRILYDLPDGLSSQRFSIGSPTPIPFWISDKCHVIKGDADKEEPIKLFGHQALRNPVLADISRLLDDARSGRINDRMKEWVAENIANGFGDVFFETPVRSRYWVTRYRVAVAKARKLTKPPHPIDAKLRLVAGEWFRHFGTKTDLSKLCGMLGSSANEIYSKRQMTDIVFAFLMNKLASNDLDDIDVYIREKTLHAAFPTGIYFHYIDHGWPRVPFQYNQLTDLIERMMHTLLEGHEQENYLRASKLAFLLFGKGRAPNQIESLAGTYLAGVNKNFKLVREEAKSVFKSRKAVGEWAAYAEALLDYYDQMMDLDGIINPKDRLKRVPFDKRFGVSLEYLNDLKKIKRGQW